MDLIVLDESFDPVAVIDEFESSIWTDRYNIHGDFEIYTLVSDVMISALRKNYYLIDDGSEHDMIIEDIRIETDVEEGDKLIVTGRSLETIIERRIIWEQKVIDGNLQDAVEEALRVKGANAKVLIFPDGAVTVPLIV